MDTAAILRNLDLFVTSDTALAHLAGGLGVRVWMAIPYAADWRWMLHGSDCPWYPTMRMFRQTTLGDWESVFQRIAKEVQAIQESNENKTVYMAVSPGELAERIAEAKSKPLECLNASDSARNLANVELLEELFRSRVPAHNRLDQLRIELSECIRAQTEADRKLEEMVNNGHGNGAVRESIKTIFGVRDARQRILREINELAKHQSISAPLAMLSC